MESGLKISGVLLVIFGVGVMACAIISIMMVFFGLSKPVSLFNLPGVSVDLGTVVGETVGLPKSNSKPMELFSAESVNEPLNLFAHLAIMGFLVNAGFKLGMLGKRLTEDNIKKT